MGVGAQEHRAVVLGLAQAAEQVGTVDAGGAGRGPGSPGRGCRAARPAARGRCARDTGGPLAGITASTSLIAAPVQLLLHAAHQCPVVLQLLAARRRLELFVGEQPAVLADHHGAAFVEQRVVECGPEVGAQALDREFLVVGFEGVRQLAVEQWRIGRGGEARHALQRPFRRAPAAARRRRQSRRTAGGGKCSVSAGGPRS